RLLFSERRYAQLLEVLEHQAQTATNRGLTRKEVSLAHLRVGQVLERHLSRPEAALRAYERAVEFAPEFRPPQDAIERLLHVQSDTQGLLKFYQRELESTPDQARKSFLHALSGQLSIRVGDHKVASKHLVALLKSQPDHMIALQSLARLMAKQGRKQELLKITSREASLTQSPSRKAKLLHRCGELHLEANDIENARRCFEEALETRDDYVPALQSLYDVLQRQGDHEGLVDSLRQRLLYAPDRHSRATIHIEIAMLLANELGRPEEALDMLDVMLSRWPEHLPAIHMAARLAESLKDWRKLTTILDSHILATRSTRGRAILLHQSAMIHATHLGDDETACRLLTRALAFWPDLGVARAKLLQLYEKLGRSRELHSLAEAALDVERSTDARQALALQLAELTPRVEVAMQYLEPVAKARPNDFVTHQRLARAALYARKDQQEATARRQLAEIVRGNHTPDLKEVHTQTYLAGCALERAKQLDEADALFTSILDGDPEFVVAVRARKRIKALRSELSSPVTQDRLESTDDASDAEAAALANIAAEIMERRGRYEEALVHLKRARTHAPDYLPALHTEARVLAR
ncbi:MAG: tetratricopeptide repeat protein, partial [Nannocystaceae bacterium]